MKAIFEHIKPNLQNSSFTAYRRETNYFDFNWHYHPELELTFIEKGSGTRLVGDHTESFEEGDLVLLGSNLPHTWVSDEKKTGQSAIVIQFHPEMITKNQFDTPEFTGIINLISRAQRGVYFSENISDEFQSRIAAIIQKKGIIKLTELWRVLDLLSQTQDYRFLASPIYRPNLGTGGESRLDIACKHIHEHFTRKIPLPEIARTVGMTETSFCRFFKKMTGKSFTNYLNELRVSKARKLLSESELNISEVAYASGFESMTHFNRVFLKMNGMAPRAYRIKVRNLV